ncbi:MAG: condensation domain-containing protein, partial [Rhodothermales bacterium]
SDPAATLPIGRPLPNTQVYVLDEYQQPVPIGTPGELYIGGQGVARGYLHRPHLTAERFLADPFADGDGSTGGRLYRTGDRARYRSDGVVEFLGRLDDQVKVRGYRIEPGEVEAALTQHPGVQTCAVVVREDAASEPRLVAYAVPADVRPPSPGALRRYLGERLPPQMVASAVVLLSELPRTPHGKLDRRALPKPDQTSEAAKRPFDPPRTSAEQAVAETWADVLGLESVGRHDNFFMLGGTSLHAIRIAARLRERLGVTVPLSTLLEAPTVEALARAVSQPSRAGSLQGLPARTNRQTAPLSLAQQRLWTLHQMQPESPFYNVVNGFRLRGALDRTALQRAFDALLERHDALRTCFQDTGDGPEQAIEPPQPVPVGFIDLAGVAPQEREKVLEKRMRAEVEKPFRLDNDLMLRALLVRLSAQEHALLIVVHHIAVDGWATDVLLRELSALYAGFAGGTPFVLPEPAVRYADFGAWHRTWLHGGVLDEQLAYWQEKLRGPLPVLEIPGDRPRPPEPSYAGARRVVAFRPELTEPLRRLGRQEEATLFMTLLAAYKALLYAYTGFSGNAPHDMLVGTNVANRHWVGVEDVVGFFANLLVLRTDLSGNPSFRDVLARVRQTALDAYAHPDVPFDVLVEAVQPVRDPRYTPLVQTVFSLRPPLPMLEAEGLAATPLNIDNGSAKFDLVFDVIDDGDRLRGALEYNTDVFSEVAANRLLGLYQTLLETIIANPDVRLETLAETLAETNRQRHTAEADVRRAANQDKLKRLSRKAVRPAKP